MLVGGGNGMPLCTDMHDWSYGLMVSCRASLRCWFEVEVDATIGSPPPPSDDAVDTEVTMGSCDHGALGGGGGIEVSGRDDAVVPN
jgi:hypothetical protein